MSYCTGSELMLMGALFSLSKAGVGPGEEQLVGIARLPLVFECDLQWADLEGTARERHCTACNDRVVNLSVMTKREADAFLDAAPESQCVRYATGPDGEMLFAPPPHRLSPRPRRLALALALPLVACEPPINVIDVPPVSQPVVAAEPECEHPIPPSSGVATTKNHHEHMGKPRARVAHHRHARSA